jgi:glutathione S-transferase
MAALKLHDLELSGNCYKVRLFCALLGLPLHLAPVDYLGGAHKKSPVIDFNPFGQIPVLEDGDVALRDSQAILVYLAWKYGGEDWLPTDAAGMAEVVSWLMVAENEIARGPADARLHDKFGVELDVDLAREKAAHILGLLEAHLQNHDWLALGRPTMADVACMPYVALGHEGGVSLAPYPAVRAWIDRIKALPGFITMPAL